MDADLLLVDPAAAAGSGPQKGRPVQINGAVLVSETPLLAPRRVDTSPMRGSRRVVRSTPSTPHAPEPQRRLGPRDDP